MDIFTTLINARNRYTSSLNYQPADLAARRTARFALQSTAQFIFSALHKAGALQDPREFASSMGCLTWVINKGLGASVVASDSKATYGGLQRCKSVWSCVCCSAFITEKRRDELGRIAKAHIEKHGAGSVVMATRTFSHNAGDVLADLMSKLKEVEDVYKSGRWLKDFKTKHVVVGTVRALEITWGRNGFHPHIHELFFLDKENDPSYGEPEVQESVLESLRSDVYARWSKQLNKVGLSCSAARGVDVRIASVAEYVAKFGTDADKKGWGVDSEMTKLHTKNGKTDSLTPFDFLRVVALKDVNKEVKDVAAGLWIEYVRATRGRVQLQYSRGLKSLYYGFEEVEDDGDAEDDEALKDLLTSFPDDFWTTVVKSKKRGELLKACETYLATSSANPKVVEHVDEDGVITQTSRLQDDSLLNYLKSTLKV